MPSDPAVVAACLAAPWGLAVLPDGASALVGERTTGRILLVAPQTEPKELTTVTGVDATGSGGLLGIALSPGYTEDGLVYVYVTTKTDNRVLRLAQGDVPKPVLTGIPKGRTHNGGSLKFAPDGSLIVGTGDIGKPELAKDPKSLAGKVLRITEFGKPATDNPDPDSAVYSSGFTDITGICAVPGGMGVLDHRPGTDVLVKIEAGADRSSLGSGDTVWRWKTSEGGANDCALGSRQLAYTSPDNQQLVGIPTTADGGFRGTPTTLVDKTYGRLLSLEAAGFGTQQETLWATTTNKDGKGKPTAADERVIVVLSNPQGGGGDGGSD